MCVPLLPRVITSITCCCPKRGRKERSIHGWPRSTIHDASLCKVLSTAKFECHTLLASGKRATCPQKSHTPLSKTGRPCNPITTFQDEMVLIKCIRSISQFVICMQSNPDDKANIWLHKQRISGNVFLFLRMTTHGLLIPPE